MHDLFKPYEPIIESLYNEDFSKTDRVHDYRNYVPSEFIKAWKELSNEVRIAVYLMAYQQALNEEWD